jgi:curved DNA-binding protein
LSQANDYKDYYAALGVSKEASADEIQKAYRKLARKHHPDVNKDPKSADKFREAAEAYEVLKDADKRAKYDRYGSAWKAAHQQGAGGAAGGPPPGYEEFSWAFGGDGRGARGFQGAGSPEGFSSFFEMLFGGAGAPGSGGARAQGAPFGNAWVAQGSDHEARLELGLEEAARGGARDIELGEPQGSTSKVRLQIPRGVKSGQRLRLSGKGGSGAGGARSGDLYLRIDIAPHPVFKLDGSDLAVTVPIAPWTAALGGEARVPTLDGPVTVRVPAGSSSGKRIRLKGKGYPVGGGAEGAGDLLAEFRLVVPDVLSDRERELFEELAKSSEFKPGE